MNDEAITQPADTANNAPDDQTAVSPNNETIEKPGEPPTPDNGSEEPDQAAEPSIVKKPTRPNKNKRLQRKLYEQTQRLSKLEETNNQILSHLKQMTSANGEINAAPSSPPQADKSSLMPDDTREVVENWNDDLSDAQDESPEVVRSVKAVESGNHPLGTLSDSAKRNLLINGLTPYDVHNLVQHVSEKEWKRVADLSPAEQIREVNYFLVSLDRDQKPFVNKNVKSIPQPTGVLKGQPNVHEKKLTAGDAVREIQKRAGLG